ncbi:MAG: TetR/AcrR family transcriptional regulator [Verrucomicrobiales bacterium]|nr:TetR/AcrR family transcriptional regulator [Verrucomicrobiales bacterium]
MNDPENPPDEHNLKPTRRKADRPDEIVQAAMEVFLQVGFARAKVTDIARKAGAAKGTVYLYFTTKDHLFEAVVRRFIGPMLNQMDAYVSNFKGTSRELLSGAILICYEQLADNPTRRAILRIMISEGHRFPGLVEIYHRDVVSAALNTMRRIIDRGVRSGEFRPTAAKDFPQVIVGPVMMSAIWKLTFDNIAPIDISKVAESHLDLLFEGLLA